MRVTAMNGRGGRAVPLAILALLLGLAVGAPHVSAHADFLTSTPDPYAIWNAIPTAVSVTVSEAVQPGSATLLVTNLTTARVDTGPTVVSPTDPTTFSVRLLSGIGPSVYTVTWGVVSADDGHFSSGTFYFMVAYKDGTLPGQFPQTGPLVLHQPLSAVDTALEAANFVGFSIAFGGSLLVALLWSPLQTSLEPSDRTGPRAGFRALVGFARWGAIALAAAAGGLWIENLIRVPPSDAGGLVASTFLLARALQLGCGVVMVLLLSRILARPAEPPESTELPPEFLPLLFLGFVVILLDVSASHSASAAGWWPLGPIADAVHLYGAALWVGGLLAILRARPWLRSPTPPAFSRDLLAAFSRFAFLGALLVVSAGAVLAFVLVGTLDGLVGTPYGWIVLAKGFLLVPILVLGAWNRRTLHREAAVDHPEPEDLDRLARNVRAEAIVGAVILVLAGLLVTINPAAAPSPKNPTFLLDATGGGLYGLFEMNPYPSTPGTYFLQLTLYYPANGTPFLAGGNGSLTLFLAGGNTTGFNLTLDGPHDNHYFVTTTALDRPGTWTIQANVAGPSGARVALTYTVSLHA